MKESDANNSTMGAETGYDVDEQPPPVRPSGFIALLFGLGSGVCLLGRPLLFLPLFGVFFALFALRYCKQGIPVGTTAAKIGLLLSVGFGCAGFWLPWFEERTVGKEAAYFAEEYIRLVIQDDYPMALELGHDHINRISPKMSLQVHYDNIKARAEPNGRQDNAVMEFEHDEVVQNIQNLDVDVKFVLQKTPRVYTKYGTPQVDTIWNTERHVFKNNLLITMAYIIEEDTGLRQWYMKRRYWSKEQLVAEADY